MIYILLILGLTDVTRSIRFSENEVAFELIKGYQVPRIRGCNFIPHPGEPQLPVKPVYFLLPEGTTVKEVKVKSSQSLWLPGEYTVYPSQPPQILEIPNFKSQIPKFIEPKSEVYELAQEYPGKLIEFVGEGSMRGYRIAELLIYPLQWIPNAKRLKLYTEIQISVELSEDRGQKTEVRRNIPFEVKQIIKSLVINPEMLNSQTLKLSDSYEYLIITSDGLAGAFEPFADWKTSKGVPAVIRTTSWINTNYSGRDLAEKIRNFLKVAVQDSGVLWVLLGGDTGVVPARTAYAMTSAAGIHSREDSIQADLYYSDLDGSWDANNNNTFGEVEDSVDLYPDVFVGRAPVSDTSEAQSFINKVIKYEQNPPTDYLCDGFFMAEILWTNPYTDAGIGKNMIGELFPNNFTILKLYESMGNENWTTVMNALNSGKSLLNHDGHAWYNVMAIGPDVLRSPDMDALTNGNKQGILYSIGCWPAAFDFDCIAEHWLCNPNGGGVAFIGNSRYGWGSPGNPGYGYSDKMDESFYYNLFEEDVSHIGATIAKTKLDYVACSRNKNVWRWHQYQVNLLGDPEMDIWTTTPSNFPASYPESVSIGESVFRVSTGLPIEGVLVCCEKEGEVYERGYTNEAGEISFNIHPTSSGDLQMWASYHNYLPHQGSVKVYSAGPYPGYYSYTIADSGGNGEVNPGEVIDLVITLKNYGAQPANNVNAYLITTDPYVTILDGSGDFGNINPGDTAQSSFSFRVGSCSNEHLIKCKLEIAGFGSVGLNFLVKTPWLTYAYYAVNSTPEPGDTFDLWITIKNTGGLAPNTKCKIRSQDPNLITIDTLKEFGALGVDFIISRPYRASIQPNCPSPYFAPVILELSSNGYSFADTFLLSIGRGVISFLDNFESGAFGWTHGGIKDLWTFTNHNSHSPTHSRYCGNTGTWEYENNMNCWLLSPKIILGPNSWLSFWSWFDVATYGVDGIYPIIKRGAVEDTLEFMGSGGALTDFIVDWSNHLYDLSSYPVGCTLQVKFSFISDNNDIAQGFYIDDVRIGEFETLPNLRMGLFAIEDSLGDNDGIVDPGESVYVYVWLINEGTTPLIATSGTVTCTDPNVTILPGDSLGFGDIFGRRVAEGWFSFAVSPSAPIGYELVFALQVDEWTFDIRIKVGVGVEEGNKISRPYFLCSPNPFTHSTIISYRIPFSSKDIPVSIKIYDVAGRIAETLVNKPMESGSYKISWNGQKYKSGIYFIRFEVPGYTSTRKLILLR